MGTNINFNKILGKAKGCSITLKPSSPFDPDAQAFITAASITDPTQQAAINTLVVDLKGYNIWTKMKALYPFVGGTSTSTSYNLKNTAQFQISWIGGWTWNNNGVTGNGLNTKADTNLNGTVSLLQNNNSIGFYSRTNNTANAVDCGTNDYTIQNFAGTLYYRLNSGSYVNVGTSRSDGFFTATRRASNEQEIYRNGVSLNTNTNTSVVFNNLNIYFGDWNTVAPYPSNRNYAFAFVGDGLTDTEAANFYTAVQVFQTTLGRSIGTQTVSDADAQAFVTAADIQDQVEANAINNLVIGLKSDGLWTKMKALYPMVGGTSTSTSYNLVNTSLYQISWNGGITHSSNGVQFGGVNGYGDTFLNAASVLTQDSTHLSFYSRTDVIANSVEMGINASARQLYLLYRYGSAASKALNRTQAIAGSLYTPTNGLLIANRPNSTTEKYYHKGSLIDTITSSSTGTISANIYIGGYNNTVVPTSREYSSKQCAFASIGDGLTDTDATNLNTRVTTFQTALNRNV